MNLKNFGIHEFYSILKMPTEFYFEIQYFILIIKLLSRFFAVTETLNSDKSRLKSVLFGVRISNSPLFPFNSCFNTVHLNNVVLNFTELYSIS